MDNFPDGIRFRFSWRPYQLRILGELQKHFQENRIHLVAPPGSGKTVIGLETLIRLGRPALILAPTQTGCRIWLEKFIELFLPPASVRPEWISTDIRNPGFLTIVTYRDLLGACSGSEGFESPEGTDFPAQVVKILLEKGVRSLLLDEAQHLSVREWESLTSVRDRLDSVFTVSLTSAPAYDLSLKEWERYTALSGPLDEEISIPELVHSGDLCPHQDLLFFSTPVSQEQAHILEFRKKSDAFFRDFLGNREFRHLLESYPWVKEPAAHAEGIFKNLDQAVNIASYLAHARSPALKKLLRFIKLPMSHLPRMDMTRVESFLFWILNSMMVEMGQSSGPLTAIQERLKEISAIQSDRVCLRTNRMVGQITASSFSKLDSVLDIVRFESDSLGGELKMIIVAQRSFSGISQTAGSDVQGDKILNILTVFDKMRTANLPYLRQGIVSESGAILPSGSETTLNRICTQLSLDPDDLEIRTLAIEGGFIHVRFKSDDRIKLGILIARFFKEGGLNILIGPQEFLEEYFYTDQANALVLVNRDMAGKGSMGIRSCATRDSIGRAGKTANIWHLVCVDVNNREAGEDYERLCTGFRAFMGPPLAGGMITNGITRVSPWNPPFSIEKIAAMNGTMMVAACQRDALKRRWFDAFEVASEGGHVHESIKFRPFPFFRTIILGNGVLMLGLTALCMGLIRLVWKYEMIVYGKLRIIWAAANEQVRRTDKIDVLTLPPMKFTDQELGFCVLGIFLVIAFVFLLPRIIDSVTRMFRHISFKWSIRQVGQALLVALRNAGIIYDPKKNMKIAVSSGGHDHILCWLRNAGPYDSGIFLDNFEEIVMPIISPRFILNYNNDYFFAVPPVFSSDKDTAMVFCKQWRMRIIRMKLVDLTSQDGRSTLVLAKNCTRKYHTDPERVYFWG